MDHAGFEAEMKEQRDRARSARADVKSMQVQGELLANLTEKVHLLAIIQQSTFQKSCI